MRRDPCHTNLLHVSAWRSTTLSFSYIWKVLEDWLREQLPLQSVFIIILCFTTSLLFKDMIEQIYPPNEVINKLYGSESFLRR